MPCIGLVDLIVCVHVLHFFISSIFFAFCNFSQFRPRLNFIVNKPGFTCCKWYGREKFEHREANRN